MYLQGALLILAATDEVGVERGWQVRLGIQLLLLVWIVNAETVTQIVQ